jgi:hypothetical protein
VGYAADLGQTKSGIFFAKGLDDPNHVDPVREIRFLVQVLFACAACRMRVLVGIWRRFYFCTTKSEASHIDYKAQTDHHERNPSREIFETDWRGALAKAMGPLPALWLLYVGSRLGSAPRKLPSFFERAASSLISHSQTVITRHPMDARSEWLALSRSTFRASFGIQYSFLVRGMFEIEHPCMCQKQPCT